MISSDTMDWRNPWLSKILDRGIYQAPLARGVTEAQVRALGNDTYDGFIIFKSVRDGKEGLLSICKLQQFQVVDGKIKVALAGWKKTSKNGKQFLSVSF